MLTNPPVPFDFFVADPILCDCTTSPINQFVALVETVVETRDSPQLDGGLWRFLRVRRHLTLAFCTVKIMSRSMQWPATSALWETSHETWLKTARKRNRISERPFKHQFAIGLIRMRSSFKINFMCQNPLVSQRAVWAWDQRSCYPQHRAGHWTLDTGHACFHHKNLAIIFGAM